MKIVNNKVFFCYELFQVLYCPFGSLDHEDFCGSKSPSYHDAFSAVSSMFMNKFHEIGPQQSVFYRNYSKSCHGLLDHLIMENPLCSKSPSCISTFSQVSTM